MRLSTGEDRGGAHSKSGRAVTLQHPGESWTKTLPEVVWGKPPKSTPTLWLNLGASLRSEDLRGREFEALRPAFEEILLLAR
jgi:hypothetical protein